MSEPVVFSDAFTVLLQHPQHTPSPEAVHQLQALGLDPTKPLLPGYPLATWTQALPVFRADYYLHLGDDEAYAQLGHDVVDGLRRTRLGQAKHARNVAIGFARALERLGQTLRMSNNHLDNTLEPRSPGEYQLTLLPLPEFLDGVRAAGLPPGAFYTGMLLDLLRGWGVESAQVALVDDDRAQLRLTFRLTGAVEPAGSAAPRTEERGPNG